MPRLHRQGGIVIAGRQRQCRVNIAKAGASHTDDASTSPRHNQLTAKALKRMMLLSLTVHRVIVLQMITVPFPCREKYYTGDGSTHVCVSV